MKYILIITIALLTASCQPVNESTRGESTSDSENSTASSSTSEGLVDNNVTTTKATSFEPTNVTLEASIVGDNTFDILLDRDGQTKTSSEVIVEVKNTGDAVSGTLRHNLSPGDFFISPTRSNCLGRSLPPGGGCVYFIRAKANTPRILRNVLSISHDKNRVLQTRVNLIGIVDLKGRLSNSNLQRPSISLLENSSVSSFSKIKVRISNYEMTNDNLSKLKFYVNGCDSNSEELVSSYHGRNSLYLGNSANQIPFGSNVIFARFEDGNNISQCSNAVNFTRTIVSPSIKSINSDQNKARPQFDVNVQSAGMKVKLYNSAGCTGEVLAQAQASGTLVSLSISRDLSYGDYRFSVRSFADSDIGEVASNCSSSVAYSYVDPNITCQAGRSRTVNCTNEIANSSSARKIYTCDSQGYSEVAGSCRLVSCKSNYTANFSNNSCELNVVNDPNPTNPTNPTNPSTPTNPTTPSQPNTNLSVASSLGMSCNDWMVANGKNLDNVRLSTSISNRYGHCLYVRESSNANECLELERNTSNEFYRPVASCKNGETTILEESSTPMNTLAKVEFQQVGSGLGGHKSGSYGETCDQFFNKRLSLSLDLTRVDIYRKANKHGGRLWNVEPDRSIHYDVASFNRCLYRVDDSNGNNVDCVVGHNHALPQVPSGRKVRPVTGCMVPGTIDHYILSVAKTRASKTPKLTFVSLPLSDQRGSGGQSCQAWFNQKGYSVRGMGVDIKSAAFNNSTKSFDYKKCLYMDNNVCKIGDFTQNSFGSNAYPVRACNINNVTHLTKVATSFKSTFKLSRFLPQGKVSFPVRGQTCAQLFNPFGVGGLTKVLKNGRLHDGSKCVYKDINYSTGRVSCTTGDWNNNPGNAIPTSHCQDNHGDVLELALSLGYTPQFQKLEAGHAAYREGVWHRHDIFDIRKFQKVNDGIFTYYKPKMTKSQILAYLRAKLIDNRYNAAENVHYVAAKKVYEAYENQGLYKNEYEAGFYMYHVANKVRAILQNSKVDKSLFSSNNAVNGMNPYNVAQNRNLLHSQIDQAIVDLDSQQRRTMNASQLAKWQALGSFGLNYDEALTKANRHLGTNYVPSSSEKELLRKVYLLNLAKRHGDFMSNQKDNIVVLLKFLISDRLNIPVVLGYLKIGHSPYGLGEDPVNAPETAPNGHKVTFNRREAQALYSFFHVENGNNKYVKEVARVSQNHVKTAEQIAQSFRGIEPSASMINEYDEAKFGSPYVIEGSNDYADKLLSYPEISLRRHQDLCLVKLSYFNNPSSISQLPNFVSRFDRAGISQAECFSYVDKVRRAALRKTQFKSVKLNYRWVKGLGEITSYKNSPRDLYYKSGMSSVLNERDIFKQPRLVVASFVNSEFVNSNDREVYKFYTKSNSMKAQTYENFSQLSRLSSNHDVAEIVEYLDIDQSRNITLNELAGNDEVYIEEAWESLAHTNNNGPKSNSVLSTGQNNSTTTAHVNNNKGTSVIGSSTHPNIKPPYVPVINIFTDKSGGGQYRPVYIQNGDNVKLTLGGKINTSQVGPYNHVFDLINIYSDSNCNNKLFSVSIAKLSSSVSNGSQTFGTGVEIPFELPVGNYTYYANASNKHGTSACSSGGKQLLANTIGHPDRHLLDAGAGVRVHVRSNKELSHGAEIVPIREYKESIFNLRNNSSARLNVGKIGDFDTVELKPLIAESYFEADPWDTISLNSNTVVVRGIEARANAHNQIACQVLEKSGNRLVETQVLRHDNTINQYYSKQQGYDTPYVQSLCHGVSRDGSMIFVLHNFDVCHDDKVEQGIIPCAIENTMVEIYMKNNGVWVSTYKLRPTLQRPGIQGHERTAFMGTRLVPVLSRDKSKILVIAKSMYNKFTSNDSMNEIGAAYIFKKSGASYIQTAEIIGNESPNQEGHIEVTNFSNNANHVIHVKSVESDLVQLWIIDSISGTRVDSVNIAKIGSKNFQRVTSAIVSNDRSRVAIVADFGGSVRDQQIIVYKKVASTWVKEGSFRDENPKSIGINKISFSPNGSKIAAAIWHPGTDASVMNSDERKSKLIRHLVLFENNSSGWRQTRMIIQEDVGLGTQIQMRRVQEENMQDIIPLRFNSESEIEVLVPSTGYYRLKL